MKSEEPLAPVVSEGEHHDPHFEPIISLPEVHIPTMEEEEVVLIQLRAKLFRLDPLGKEWKERGTGEVKLLHHEKHHTVRVVMRRDKTLKLCANHYVTPIMELKPNCGSDRAWVWNTFSDFSDGTPQSEILAIKFINSETAKKWKVMFETAKSLVGDLCYESSEDEDVENDDDQELATNTGCDESIIREINSLNLNTDRKAADDSYNGKGDGAAQSEIDLPEAVKSMIDEMCNKPEKGTETDADCSKDDEEGRRKPDDNGDTEKEPES